MLYCLASIGRSRWLNTTFISNWFHFLVLRYYQSITDCTLLHIYLYVYCVYTVSITNMVLMFVLVSSSISSLTLFSCPFFCLPAPGIASCHTMLRHLCGTARNSEDRGAVWDCTGGCGLPPLGVTPSTCLQTTSSTSPVCRHNVCCKPLDQPSEAACTSPPAAEKRLWCHAAWPKGRLRQKPPLQISGRSNASAFFSSKTI